MKVGDRARLLVSRGVDHLEGADISVPASLYRQRLARELLWSRAVLALTVAITTWVVASRASMPSVAERTELFALEQAGVDAEHPLPADLRIRLAMSPTDVSVVTTILRSEGSAPPDLSWAEAINGDTKVVTDSRAAALHGLVTFLEQRPAATWEATLLDLQSAGGLRGTAGDLMRALGSVPMQERRSLPDLIQKIMALPSDSRLALYRAGFPAVPSDPEGQELYRLLGTADSERKMLVFRFLTNRDVTAISRITSFLRYRRMRQILGGFADGAIKDLTWTPALSRCDVGVAGSCGTAR